MILKEWEIWHTFASYFVHPINDLEMAARNMVASGLIRSAFLDNGDYFWLDKSQVQKGHMDITLGANLTEALIKSKEELPDGYEGQVLMDSTYFRFVELQNYSRAKGFPPRYIRGHLGECVLISNDFTYLVYPIIKLFETGVILIEMRTISPAENINLERFIEEYVNLFKKSWDNVLIPPGLRIAAQHAFALTEKPKSQLLLKIASFWLDREIRNNIKNNTVSDQHDGLEFQYIPLWDLEVLEKEKADKSKNQDPNYKPYTIYDLAKDIFHAVSITIPGLRQGKALLWKPNTPLAVGKATVGRSHVHLLKFQDQTTTAQQNHVRFKNQFGWIKAGAFEKRSSMGKQFLPPNDRMFSDYGAYISENGSLWTWSKKGIASRISKTTPRSVSLIFPNQVTCEMLEYGYMLHRRMLESVGKVDTSATALNSRESLVEVQDAISNISGYGEIRDLLMRGWKAMGVDELQKAISELITIRHSETSAKEERRLVALQTVLTLVFGVLAIPSFSTGVVKPLWSWLNLWLPTDKNAAEVLLFLVALIVVEIPILLIAQSMLRRK